MASAIRITRGYVPGAIGRVVALHGAYYAREWGFGPQFEAEVARELGAFMERYDPRLDGFWLAWNGEEIMASVTLDHAADTDETPEAGTVSGGGARVRWFIASEAARGTGVGGALFDALLAFADETRQRDLYLWTFDGLSAARRLYERAGFTLTESAVFNDWGPSLTAQRMVRRG